MDKKLSLYREYDEPVVVFHNRNSLPYVGIPHLHSQYEFCYNIEGAHGLFIDKKLYECTGRDLFLIPKTYVHKIMVPKDGYYERCIINIDPKTIDAINAAPNLHRPLAWMEGAERGAPKKVNLNEKEHMEFVSLVDAYSQTGQSELKRYAALLEILSFLSDQFRSAKCGEGKIKQPSSVPEHALIMIEENFRDIQISDISKRLFVSSSYLSEIFRQAYGITLGQYLIIRKIAEAKKYLYMGVPVHEVCELSGFRNYSNFIRTFKKFEGYSPGNLDHLSDPL